jgi:hypothetical protein
MRSWDRLRRFFVPTYTERGLFLMALSFVLLALFNAELKSGIMNIMKKAIESHDRNSLWVIVVSVLFISGFILSIYHAFSSKPKSEIEKTIMLVFALGINGITGVIAGLRILNDHHGFLIVFPALNILSSIVLIYLIGFADSAIIDDSDVSLWELLLGSIIVFTTFYFCQFWFDLHWSVTFSICVAYAMSVNDMIGRLFLKRTAYRQNIINRNNVF